ncbi:double zinc ribbon and ankyrin repeat domains 1 [Cichlidogyrus casuarinus]|uniref:Double zinc ribbon and ankyrin repeat domains 1 n=1 Tax=Cichlidogyrus casuarinus TaxID=1844966 RepID=A0ABD2PVT3_9PLAT
MITVEISNLSEADTAIFFTTNGESPDLWRRKKHGQEVTYRYKGPFCLKEGRRTVKAVAANRFTKAESNVVVRTFDVRKYQPLSDSPSEENSVILSDDGDPYPISTKPSRKPLQPISYEEYTPEDDFPSNGSFVY